MTSPFNSKTGFHAIDIDLTDNTDSGFYAAGYLYAVVLSPDTETVDSQTITAVVLAYFEIGPQPVNAKQIGGTDQTAKDLGAINVTNLNTLSGHDPGATLGTSTLTQAQVSGGAYALNHASFAFNAALPLTTQQKADVTAAVPTTAQIEAALLNEGDGQALLAAISAQVQALFNEGTDVPISTLVSLIAAQITTDHGSGSYARNTEPPTVGQIRTEMEGASTKLTFIRAILEADIYIDTGVSPWAIVFMTKGSGGIGVGTELLRQRIYDTGGTGITDTDTVPGRQVAP